MTKSSGAAQRAEKDCTPSKKEASPTAPRRAGPLRSRLAAAVLAMATVGVGVAGAGGALDRGVVRTAHGEARLFFPPWLNEKEVVLRIHRAGGVPISEPGQPLQSGLLFRAITARADFAARIRAEGALFVLF